MKFSEKFSIGVALLMSVICLPVGVAQCSLWINGKDYSSAFMALGVFFPFWVVAKIVEIRRKSYDDYVGRKG